jgi:hypothetical protein
MPENCFKKRNEYATTSVCHFFTIHQKDGAILLVLTTSNDDFGHPFPVDFTKILPNLGNGSFPR